MAINSGKDAIRIREEIGLTQEELAAFIGAKREAISRVEQQAKLTIYQRIAYFAIHWGGLKFLKALGKFLAESQVRKKK